MKLFSLALIVSALCLVGCATSQQMKPQHKAVGVYLSVMDQKNVLSKDFKDAKFGLFKPASGKGEWNLLVQVRKSNDKWYWLRENHNRVDSFVHLKRPPCGYVYVKELTLEEAIDLSMPHKTYVEPVPQF